MNVSVADPGSGAFLTPGSGSGIRNRFIPDPGSRIPDPYFLEFSVKFMGKQFYNSLKTGPSFFLKHFKNKIIFNFVKFVATKYFFSPLSSVEVFGSWIRDQGSRVRDG